MIRATWTPLLLLILPTIAAAADGNRLTYLDVNDPYYPSRTFPKLVTPQWVGEEGVEAVVILAIDDMRGHEKWEAYLRPILSRLKEIDGRAPVSIMTCQIKPDEPHLQKWLKEGVSIDVHTVDHPCPLLRDGDFAKAKSTVDRCIDLLNEIPGNRPVAFRMPCCDSLNTLSPRFFAEIFNKTTPKSNFLSVDSSVFTLFTANDPELPRELVLDADGSERFRKYLPRDRTFANTIEDYPYPYVINRLCWEFPCMVPSDWAAQHLQKPNNPVTVRDWKAALDAVVIKQGVFDLVFHPHGWIKAEQVVELIDHAVEKHGKKVKFLTFREAHERLVKHLLNGHALRDAAGRDNGVRLLDVNGDGFLDVVIGNEKSRTTRVWSPQKKTWKNAEFPVDLTVDGSQFGVEADDRPGVLVRDEKRNGAWRYEDGTWKPSVAAPVATADRGKALGVRLRDLDGDGVCELLATDGIYRRDGSSWERLSIKLPEAVALDAGLRFVDIDGDGRDDVLYSNEERYSLHLWTSIEKGWDRKVLSGKRSDAGALPMISRKGTDNGAWFHSRTLFVQNEDTNLLKDLVDRRTFNELLAEVEPGPRSPEASLNSLTPRPGFRVELVAAEPLVQDPVAFAWGPDGKFWVVEMGDYPLGIDGKGKPGGRVKFLEDTNGDGKYDKATLFLDGLGFPTGVTPWRNGVLVTCAPDILYATDLDGDGKADTRVALYTGLTEGNQQHRVNTLAWGLDGWIHCANGDSGGQVKSLKTGKIVNIRGRDFRIRPDTGDLDLLTGQTQFGRTRDDRGNWFGGNNSNALWHYALEDRYLRRNPHVAAPDPRVTVPTAGGAGPVFPQSRTLPRFNDPHTANRFTSACSPIIYRDDLLGPSFAGNAFISEPVHNLVHRLVLTPSGTTFTGRRAVDEQTSEFLASTDNWFRPTMIATGPDGALWIADMYRHVIEHPQWIPKDWQRRLDLRAGHDRGRIYRVLPVDAKPRTIPKLSDLDTAKLVAALDSPNGWQRDTVHRLLLERRDPASTSPLEALSVSGKHPYGRMHALCALDGLDALKPELLIKALADSNGAVRTQALRLCESRFKTSPELGAAAAKLTTDPDVHVRMQAAYTLGEWNDPRVGKALADLGANAGDDRFLLAAVLSSVNDRNLDSVLTASMADDKVTAVLMEPLLRIATGQKDNKATARLLVAVARPQEGRFTAAQFLALSGLLEALESQRTTLASLADDAELKPSVDATKAMFAAARGLAVEEKASASDRAAALRILGRGPDQQDADVDLLAGLLVPQTPVEVQSAAVAALGMLSGSKVPQAMLQHWRGHGPAVRSQILEVLSRRDEWLTAVLNQIEENVVYPSEVDAVRKQQWLTHRTRTIRERAAKVFAGSINADRQKVIDAYAKAADLPGDAARGQELFKKHCAACHKLGDVGQVVGPDLASLGDKSPGSILVALLDPNRAVEARYVRYVAQLRNGLSYSGVLTVETATSVTLVDAEGKPHVILRTDLEELSAPGGSAMPEGLEKDIKVQDAADLIALLRGSGPAVKRKEFPGNTPVVVSAAADGSLLLKATSAEIYGSTLVFEKQYGNLGYWSSVDDHAVWTIDVPKAGRYAMLLEWACPNGMAGNMYQVLVGGERLTGKVASTGSWNIYKEEKIGELNLAAGRWRLTVRSDGMIRAGAMLDLRSVKLVPMSPN